MATKNGVQTLQTKYMIVLVKGQVLFVLKKLTQVTTLAAMSTRTKNVSTLNVTIVTTACSGRIESN